MVVCNLMEHCYLGISLWYYDWHGIDPFHGQWNWFMEKI